MVSRGAQKNFVHFADVISKEWDDEGLKFNESYFRDLVAMAIMFRETEKLVTDQPWYTGGYRANIVTYAIAKLVHDINVLGLGVDLDRIWREQRVSDDLLEVLKLSARFANEVIIATDRNVTEWAKTEACWSRLKGRRIDWPEKWLKGLSTKEQLQANAAAARRSQRLLNDIQAQRVVVNAGSDRWRQVKNWGAGEGLLTQTEAGILEVAATFETTGRTPSENQCRRLLETIKRLRDQGCPVGEAVLEDARDLAI
jgi:AIPR protein